MIGELWFYKYIYIFFFFVAFARTSIIRCSAEILLENCAGPDALVPAASTICSSIRDAVQIRKSDDFATPYISMTTCLQQSADKYEDHPALGWKIDDKWTTMSYR